MIAYLDDHTLSAVANIPLDVICEILLISRPSVSDPKSVPDVKGRKFMLEFCARNELGENAVTSSHIHLGDVRRLDS